MNSSHYDTIIIGSGPAGLTAAIYASRDNLKTLLLGGGKWGGQLMLTSTVDNFPGFAEGIMGPDLMEVMKKQAGRFGAEIKLVDVAKVDFKKEPFRIWTNENIEDRIANSGISRGDDQNSEFGIQYSAKTVIVATGADTLWLGLPNEQRLIGKGVSSCAPCDAFFFKGKEVVVIGGGDSAMEETLTLAKFATKVTIVHRRDAFKASKIMQDRVMSLPNVSVCWNCAVIDVLGEEKVTGIRLKDVISGQEKDFGTDGVFLAIGHLPNTRIFENQLELDEKGYILKQGDRATLRLGSGREGKGDSKYQMATSVPGVFVAGDVHDHHYRQAVTAAAFGCMAALEVGKYLEMKGK